MEARRSGTTLSWLGWLCSPGAPVVLALEALHVGHVLRLHVAEGKLLREVLPGPSVVPGRSVLIIISAPNENSQKASKSVNVLVRTGSQMENKLHENVSKKIGRSKEHTG